MRTDIIVNCSTYDEAIKVNKYCNITTATCDMWDLYENDLCLNVTQGQYADLDFYSEDRVITAKQFLREREPIRFINLKLPALSGKGATTMKNIIKLGISYFVVKYWVVNNDLAQDTFKSLKKEINKILDKVK